MSSSKSDTTIELFDEESKDQACVIVRRCGDKVCLCISLRTDGDVETVMDRDTAARLVRALETAIRDPG
jgi:hypothetical protein